VIQTSSVRPDPVSEAENRPVRPAVRDTLRAGPSALIGPAGPGQSRSHGQASTGRPVPDPARRALHSVPGRRHRPPGLRAGLPG